jgi:hypothetical protein
VPVLVVSANSNASAYAVAHGAQASLIKSKFAMAELIEHAYRLTGVPENQRGNKTSAA